MSPEFERSCPSGIPFREAAQTEGAKSFDSSHTDWHGSCEGMGMILLVTPSERGAECSAALQHATGEDTRVAETPACATVLLRKNGYFAVVLDQYLLESEPGETDTMLEHTGGAIAVQVNLAISGMDRLVREVRAAVDRGRREEARARRAAAIRLQSELSGVMTALLLSSDLALETPGLTRSAAEKIESVHGLVQRLREQLTNAGVNE